MAMMYGEATSSSNGPMLRNSLTLDLKLAKTADAKKKLGVWPAQVGEA